MRFCPVLPVSLRLGALAALALPAVSLAQPPGWFVEADVRTVDASGVVSGFTLDDDDNGASLLFGYAFNPNFSLQAGYHDLGEHFASDCPPPLVCVTVNTDQVDVTGFSLAATGTWPIADGFEIFGTLGLMSWDADFDQFADSDDSGEDLLYGAGVAWRLVPNWKLSLRYEEVDFDLESVILGLRFEF